MDKQIKYEWARIPHFYDSFYVYKYATGLSIASYIVKRIRANDIEFKNVTSDCKEFNIYGSLVYAGNNSHLHLSNLTYCGKKDNTVYDSLECNLYEKRGDTTKVLETCKNEKNISLEELRGSTGVCAISSSGRS